VEGGGGINREYTRALFWRGGEFGGARRQRSVREFWVCGGFGVCCWTGLVARGVDSGVVRWGGWPGLYDSHNGVVGGGG